MQIEITGKKVLAGLGWTSVVLFWGALATLLMVLLSANPDSGAPMILYFVGSTMGSALPLLLVPFSIILFGLRKGFAWTGLIKWGTIATVAYIICFALFIAAIM